MEKSNVLAFDRGSVRTIDQDGRMHVALTCISKANVCGYMGSEIPDAEKFGLDPNKVYQLYRDPEELAKAAESFNNIPLLSQHVPVSVDDHQPDLVVGATGSDAVFKAPYLMNSLVIWEAAAIKGIESDTQRELSCAYRYEPDMTPGEINGIRFDGVMRNILGNHIALVEIGRAGPDVIVGDSQLVMELDTMSNKALSRKAILAKGALLACLLPKMASDAQINIDPLLVGVNNENWKEKKAGIFAGLAPLTKGKLAKDAELGDVIELLDSLDGTHLPDKDLAGDEDDQVDEKEKTVDSDGLSDEEETQYQALLKRRKPKPEGAADEPPEFAGKPKKPGMDEAIKAAAKTAEDAAVARMRAISEAEKVVRPYVGELVAQDSAEAVYKLALDTLGVNVEGVHPSAFRAILEAQKKPGDVAYVVQDSASIKSFNDRFPEVTRITAL